MTQIKLQSTKGGSLFIKQKDLFALDHVQEIIHKAAKFKQIPKRILIERAIKETLVITNPQSIHIAVNKILKL